MVLAHRVPYPPNKGDKLRTYHQLRHLVEIGCTVTVCAPLSDASDDADFAALSADLGVTVIGRRGPFRYLRLLVGAVTLKPLSVSNFYLTALQNAIDEQIVNSPADVVMCTSSCMAEYIFSSRTFGKSGNGNPRLIMDFMDLDSDKWKQYADLRGLPRSFIYTREARLLRSYERRIYEKFDECVFVSSQEVDMFQRNPGITSENLHAIGNGVDPLLFFPTTQTHSAETVHLVFVGVMDYFPNEDAMLWFVEEMWPEVRTHWPEAKLSIVGMRPGYKITRLNSVDGVDVVGFVEDVLPWFHSATMFVAPFRVARGVQNKILQAFATGVPVVTTSLGAEGIVCTPDIELLVADDKDEFVAQVNRLAASPALGGALRERALTLVSTQYSWKSQNDRLYALLDSTTKRNASKPY